MVPIFTTSLAALWQSWTEVMLESLKMSRTYSFESWKSLPFTNSSFVMLVPIALIISGIIFE